MAIVKMSKFCLTALQREKDAILAGLQDFDHVHLLDISGDEDRITIGVSREDTGKDRADVSEELLRTEEAIKLLESFEQKKEGLVQKLSDRLPELSRQEFARRLDELDGRQLVLEIKRLESDIREREEKIRTLRDRKMDFGHWEKVEFPLSDLRKAESVRMDLGVMPKRWWDDFRKYIANETVGTYVEPVSSDGKNQYLLLISNGEDEKLQEVLRDSNFDAVKLDSETSPAEQMKAFDREEEACRKEIEVLRGELKTLADLHLDDLKLYYESLANRDQLVQAKDKLLRTDYTSMIEGYIRTDSVDAFEQVVAESSPTGAYDLALQAADKDDPQVPILLENSDLVRPFESIVSTYALPLYSELDPTPLMMPWFTIFFGMMLGDLAYGLILLIGTSLMLKFLNLSDKKKAVIRFFQILSIPTIIFGAIFGSFLGGVIPLPALINPSESYMEMLMISIAIGFVNIILGLAIQAWLHLREGKAWYAMIDTGFWYMILFGLLAYGLGAMLDVPKIVGTVGMIVAAVGMVGVILFSEKDQKGFGKYAWGLYNLYGVTSYVGDFVSYTRIAALMLSGAYIGFAVNLIVKMLMGAGVGGWIVAVVVFVFFHIFNLFLSALSGYVHSMRLIYVEFFGKFYSGGGVPFKGMTAPAKYVEIKDK